MPTVDANDKANGILLMRIILVFLASWVLMLTEARIDRDTGFPGGNLSYLASLGIVGTIVLVALAKRPWSTLRS